MAGGAASSKLVPTSCTLSLKTFSCSAIFFAEKYGVFQLTGFVSPGTPVCVCEESSRKKNGSGLPTACFIAKNFPFASAPRSERLPTLDRVRSPTICASICLAASASAPSGDDFYAKFPLHLSNRALFLPITLGRRLCFVIEVVWQELSARCFSYRMTHTHTHKRWRIVCKAPRERAFCSNRASKQPINLLSIIKGKS